MRFVFGIRQHLARHCHFGSLLQLALPAGFHDRENLRETLKCLENNWVDPEWIHHLSGEKNTDETPPKVPCFCHITKLPELAPGTRAVIFLSDGEKHFMDLIKNLCFEWLLGCAQCQEPSHSQLHNHEILPVKTTPTTLLREDNPRGWHPHPRPITYLCGTGTLSPHSGGIQSLPPTSFNQAFCKFKQIQHNIFEKWTFWMQHASL